MQLSSCNYNGDIIVFFSPLRNNSVSTMRMFVLLSTVISALAFNKIGGKYLLVELQDGVQPPGNDENSFE